MAEAQIAAAMQPKTASVQTEEIDETSKTFNENMEIIEKLIRTNKQANRVEYGITRQNSPIIDY
jgi:heterodisulfide reductase subunit C